MFAVAQCTSCRRARVVDLDTKKTTCPYCGNQDVTSEMRVVARCRTEENARSTLVTLTSGRQLQGFDGETLKKDRSRRPKYADSWTSLEYRYAEAKGLDAKMSVIANDLVHVCGGEFTEQDLETLDPKNGKKILEAMLDRCLVHETAYGRYRP